jgi:tRNA G10  N-methylase Trm11
MAGSGSILLAAVMGRNVIARDVEPNWVDLMLQNAKQMNQQDLFSSEFGQIDIAQGNARAAWGFKAAHLIFSPPYGCAASPNPQARRMLPYKLATTPGIKYHERWNKLLANPGPGAMGALVFHYGEHPDQIGHWRGARYWEAMKEIYNQARISLEADGYMILVIKDHIYKGQRVRVADQTVNLCETLGFKLHERHQRKVWPLALWQRRRKERGEPTVEVEDVLVFKQSLVKII